VTASTVAGRFVLTDRVAPGRLSIEDGLISAVEVDADDVPADAPFIAPGFVDVHVHGWGGHDAMGDTDALDGMARALLRRGVTSFLPTAVTAPLGDLATFADRVRDWIPRAPKDGAEPLGFNLEGPFLAPARRGAHAEEHLRTPASAPRHTVEPLVAGLRLLTVAPELDGAIDLIRWLDGRGVAVSVGHSAAGADQVWQAYAAGARSTTHLFNAMTGVDHRSPGVAVAALLEDDVYVELIADGVHVHPGVWPLVTRLKPADRLLLVSDALSVAGTTEGRGRVGGLEIEVNDGRATLAGTETLAGSVIALDSAVRNAATAGIPLPEAVAAASQNPLALLGVTDRGRIFEGLRADLVELDEDLTVRRVMRGGEWLV
jgi:N-acetylglucosamine-6-phosphate deacetylase